jgi:hypothetical protein
MKSILRKFKNVLNLCAYMCLIMLVKYLIKISKRVIYIKNREHEAQEWLNGTFGGISRDGGYLLCVVGSEI